MEDAEFYFEQGQSLYDQGDYEEALESFGKAIEINPKHYKAWINRGWALFNKGHYQEAIENFDKAIEIDDKVPLAWINRGCALFDTGHYQEGIENFDKAIEIDSKSLLAWLNRGTTSVILGHYQEAVENFDKAIEIDSQDLYAWFYRGNALNHLERYEKAIESFDKAIEIDEQHFKSWSNRGDALDKLGRYEKAIESYNKAIEIDNKHFIPWSNRGSTLIKLGRYEEAIESADQAILIDKTPAKNWIIRSDAVVRSNIPALIPSHLALALNNRDLDEKRGYTGAVATLSEAFNHIEPHTKEWGKLQDALAKVYSNQGRRHFYYRPSEARSYYRKARTAYETALTIFTRHDDPEEHLRTLKDFTKVLFALDETEQAETLIRQGSDLLRSLLDDPKYNERKKRQLALDFSTFHQLTVDLLVKDGKLQQALKTAEADKNACIHWLLDPHWQSSDDLTSPTFEQIQAGLDPQTALIYWHLSPIALTTFIINPGATQPEVLHPLSSHQRRYEFEKWATAWRSDYQNYRDAKPQERATHPWRERMVERLDELGKILGISQILAQLDSEIERLLLIPHQDLHLFPLHSLFPDHLCIYLPTFQAGQKQTSSNPTAPHDILAIEGSTRNLSWVSLELEEIQACFDQPQLLRDAKATTLDPLWQQAQGYLHFSGHGQHNFQNPGYSSLILHSDTPQSAEKFTMSSRFDPENHLRAESIYQLDLQHYEVATFSACEIAPTGIQTITTEYVGVASAFLAAGVRYVISPLWLVQEDVSTLIMVELYRRLQGGITPPQALAQTTQWLRSLTNQELVEYLEQLGGWDKWETECDQLYSQVKSTPSPEKSKKFKQRYKEVSQQINRKKAMLANPNVKPFAHPYHWAAFICQGFIAFSI